MEGLGKLLELLAKLMPAAPPQGKALNIIVRLVVVVHPHGVAQLVAADDGAVTELEAVLELVVQAVADDVLALGDEVHFLGLFLFEVDVFLGFEVPRFEQEEKLYHEALVAIILQREVGVLAEFFPCDHR